MKTLSRKIEIITKTETNGTIIPMRFRIDGKDGQEQTYEILRINKVTEERFSGNRMRRFECEIDLDGKSRSCELKFELDSCRWMLFKI